MSNSAENHIPQPSSEPSVAHSPLQPPALPPGTAPLQGLSAHEVPARRARGQGNAAPLRTSRSYRQILRENVFTFTNNVLYLLGLALVLLGRYTNALLTVGVVSLNVLVSVVQEVRAKRKLDHIALLTRPQATVIREGQPQAIDPDEIVLGDVLLARPAIRSWSMGPSWARPRWRWMSPS